MRVTVLELAASYGEPMRVLAEIDARLAAGPATDLVVVPEAALHGYVSPERGVHLVGSLVLREGDALYNAMTCFAPTGELAFVYRKRHPWYPETWATAGVEPPPIVEIAGVQVTIAICFDLHFIADDAARELAAADLLVFSSAWVERPDTRAARLAALARQFELHIANANWAPGVVRVPGQGGSCFVAPDGTVAVVAPTGRLDEEV